MERNEENFMLRLLFIFFPFFFKISTKTTLESISKSGGTSKVLHSEQTLDADSGFALRDSGFA